MVSGHREMERESGFQGIPGESRVKLALLRGGTARSQFSHTQLPKGQPLACSRGENGKGPKKDRTLAEESGEMRAQRATRRKNKEEPQG